MNVLVLNCGSSSLRFQLVETSVEAAAKGSDRVLARGQVENIGETAVFNLEAPGRPPVRETDEILEHAQAVERVVSLLTREGGVGRIDAVGHRIVHGGERFKASVRIDEGVVTAIEECFDLAPLHNPPNVKGYRAAQALLGPDTPHVAVFDTAFHQTMEPAAYLYGLPYLLYERHRIRRYGFHGTSHRFVAQRVTALLGGGPGLRVVTCHLGNGCSVAAIRDGRSVDTSMGFTPLEGLVMGSRSGDLDPAILLHVMQKEELGRREMNALLNKHSGLLGVSGVSNDMRVLLEAEKGGHERARLAIEVFCYRLKKYIAGYVGALGGIDALAFAGGIGENAASIRARAITGLDALGLAMDPGRNEGTHGQEADISRDPGGARVLVVPTNEELLIARDTAAIVSSQAA